MSHLTAIQSQIKSVEALRMACQALNVELRVGGRARYFNGQETEECDYVVRSAKQYEVGLKRQADGTYSLIGDDMVLKGTYGYVDERFGKACGKLRQEVAYATLQIEARRKDMRLTREVRDDGKLRVIMYGG